MTDIEVSKRAFDQPQWYLTKTAYNIRVRIETIQEFTRGFHPQSILDIGCGDGSLSQPLLNGENRLTLVDRSAGMLEIAAGRLPAKAVPRVEILQGDFLTMDLSGRQYDLILCVGILAYIEARRDFLSKVAGLLRPGGRLILECSDGSHPVTRYIRFYKWLRSWTGGTEFPTVNQSSATLLKMVKDLQFVVRHSFRYSLPLPGLRPFLSQQFSYRMIRGMFGTPARNQVSWLGNECLYCLERPR